jgi:hypothetical protein
MSKSFGWIGVDLDGTLAYYDRYRGVGVIGEPIEPMCARVRQWLEEGKDVRIMTARISAVPGCRDYDDAEIPLNIDAIQEWCLEHLGQVLPITCTKDYQMTELWDDRAVQVEPNTGRRMDGLE